MEVVKQLSAELEVELSAEFCNSLSYVARLLAHVFFIVEACHIHSYQSIRSVIFTNKNYIPPCRTLSTFLDAQARIYEYGYCGCPVRNCRRNHKKRAIDDRPYELTEVPTKAVPYKAAAGALKSGSFTVFSAVPIPGTGTKRIRRCLNAPLKEAGAACRRGPIQQSERSAKNPMPLRRAF